MIVYYLLRLLLVFVLSNCAVKYYVPMQGNLKQSGCITDYLSNDPESLFLALLLISI